MSGSPARSSVEKGRTSSPGAGRPPALATSNPLTLVHSAGQLSHAERIAPLDALRGLMAWAVALYHFGILTRAFTPGSWASSIATVLGLHSVGGFFMISGFCLFHLHGGMRIERAALQRFYWQRFVRIAPLFYLVLLLHVVAGTAVAAGFSWARLLENLTFTFGAIHPNHAMVTGGWTIGLEMLFYASFPGLAVLLRTVSAHVAATLVAVGWASLHTIALEDVAQSARFDAYVVLANHAFAFLLGGLIAKLRACTNVRVATPVALGTGGAALAVLLAAQPRVWDHFAVVLGDARVMYVAGSFALVALFAFTRPAGQGARGFMCELGELSYPVYLLHPLAWHLCSSWLPQRTPATTALAVSVVTTLALSIAAHRCYERPLRRYLADRGRPGCALRSV